MTETFAPITLLYYALPIVWLGFLGAGIASQVKQRAIPLQLASALLAGIGVYVFARWGLLPEPESDDTRLYSAAAGLGVCVSTLIFVAINYDQRKNSKNTNKTD